MNWNCEVCKDEYGLNPVPTQVGAGSTLNIAVEPFTLWLCPVHTERLLKFIGFMKQVGDKTTEAVDVFADPQLHHGAHIGEAVTPG